MLRTRRSGVTVAAKILQQTGLICYNRGRIAIFNREGLKETACECHLLGRNEFLRLLSSRRG